MISLICIRSLAFQTYAGGVFADDSGTNNVNHAVLIVGYGVDADSGLAYWKIRNSWGYVL